MRNLGIFKGLTGDMKVQYHPVGAQRVGRCGGDLVYAHFSVAVLDPVIDGAYVDVRNSSAVAKVHCYTGGGAETLQEKEGNTFTLLLLTGYCVYI